MSGFEDIREHMEVIGADGAHIGTVDHIDGDRIKLVRADSGLGHDEHHHYIPRGLVAEIEGDKVRLSARGDVVADLIRFTGLIPRSPLAPMAPGERNMRTSMLLIAATGAGLAACGQSTDDSANEAATNVAAPKPEKAPYCFFKDAETKGWKASVAKDGNVVVSGKAYRSDSRYIAEIGKIDVAGTTATVRPTINPNTTGFGATDNWWDVTKTIPGSAAVETVTVKCGDKTVATLAVPRKGTHKAG